MPVPPHASRRAAARRTKLRCAVVLAPGEYTGGGAAEGAPRALPPVFSQVAL